MIRWVLLTLIILSSQFAFSQKEIVIENPNQALSIGNNIEILEDKKGMYSLYDVLKRPDVDARFIKSLQASPNFGITKSVIWSRFTLVNKSGQRLYLEIGEPVLDSISIYRVDHGTITHKRLGVYQHKSTRDIQTNLYLVDLELNSDQKCTYYIRIQNNLPLLFPLRVAPLKIFFEDNHPKDLMQGIYLGIMLVMAIFNFFIFWTVRSKEYLYYVLYVLAFAGFFSFNKGIAHEYLWPNAIWFNHFTSVFISAAISFGLLFAESFLDANKYLPASYKTVRILLSAITFFLVANWLGAGAMSTQILHSIAFLAVMYILFLAIYIWIQGSQAALFFLVAWAVMLVSALIFILQLSNVLQSDNFTRNALQVGSALEVVLLSFALAYRINYYRLEKEKYQAEVIQQLRENEQIRSRIARDLHDDIGSTLSSIGILSQVVEYQIDKNPLSVKELVQRINESSQKVQRSLSDIVWTTRQTSNSFGEVLVKMKEFAAEVFEPKNINYYFQTENLPEIQLSANKQYNLYLIFKEAINNIVKYADATEVNIEISFENSELRLFVKDNGIGFDETLIKAGNGLGNMRKRAESLGGSITILSRVGKGSSIELKVQIKQS